jgi:L-threonylcarbamoyladenylate synthase
MVLGRQTERLDANNPGDVARAAGILRDGGLVAFPTETVYGLGANALSAEAVEKIFVAKRRPHWDPLIVHIADRGQLPQVAAAGSRLAEDLMDGFWPGPLTLLLPKTPAIPDSVTAGRPLVGVRVPAHPVAQALLRAANVPIAAPSANTFGHISPTTAAHVLADLDGRIDAVLDGGATSVGVESTVAEVRGHEVVLYRPGGVSLAEIEAVVGSGTAWVYVAEPSTEAPTSLPSPGVGIRHYAPKPSASCCRMRGTHRVPARSFAGGRGIDRRFWPAGSTRGFGSWTSRAARRSSAPYRCPTVSAPRSGIVWRRPRAFETRRNADLRDRGGIRADTA